MEFSGVRLFAGAYIFTPLLQTISRLYKLRKVYSCDFFHANIFTQKYLLHKIAQFTQLKKS